MWSRDLSQGQNIEGSQSALKGRGALIKSRKSWCGEDLVHCLQFNSFHSYPFTSLRVRSLARDIVPAKSWEVREATYEFRNGIKWGAVLCCRMLLGTNPADYSGAFPAFDKPAVVGEMCVTKEREVLVGRSRAKYFHNKIIGQKCSLNLNEGYSTFESKDEMDNEKLDVLLKWVLLHSEPGCALSKVTRFLHIPRKCDICQAVCTFPFF